MLNKLTQSENGSLTVILNNLDREQGCESGTFLTLFRYCVAHKIIMVNMMEELLPTMDISKLDLKISKRTDNARRISS